MNDHSTAPPSRRPIRWWPVGLILVLAGGTYASLWFIPMASQQAFNIQVAKIVLFCFFTLLLWLMFYSRMRWRARFGILGLGIGVIALLAATFRYRGVNGNLVPVLEPRWSHQNLPALTPAAPAAVAGALPDAADFPQFLGPDRNAVLTGPNLATNWAESPPTRMWQVPVGIAWSGFAVAGRLAVTQEQRGDEECVVAYDLGNGQVVWSHRDTASFKNPLAGEGPRATPTIAGGRVFTQGATGLLNCLDLATGKVFWSKDLLKETGASIAQWGDASSPLVMDDQVVVDAGGPNGKSLLDYRINDGSLVWSCGSWEPTYSSPTVATLAGVRQIVLFADNLTGIDPATGRELWEFTWPVNHPHVAMPVIASDTDLIVSSGYGTGSARVRVGRDASGQWSATQVWRSNRMKAKFTNLITRHGYLYGLDDGIFSCLDAGTGALAWKDGRYGHGQELLVNDLLLVMAEEGEVILVDPKPERLQELARFTALEGKTWNPPALAGAYFLARNDKEAVCFRLPLRK